MLEQLKSILNSNENVTAWKVDETRTISEELFLIREKIDMNRSKDVSYFNVTVYVDTEENDKIFTGMASGKIHPTMTEDEMKEAVDELAFSAKFAKNQQFNLVNHKVKNIAVHKESLEEGNLWKTVDHLTKSILESKVEGSELNSAEVFANEIYHRIVNSNGVDVSFINKNNVVEIITESSGKEDVELFELYEFAGEHGGLVSELTCGQLEVTKYRVIAEKMPELKDLNIILRAMDVKDLLGYYKTKSNASVIYDKISDFKLNDNIQGDVVGDKLNMTLVPMLENSSAQRPVDGDGCILNDVKIIDGGQLIAIHGSNQYATYLGIEPTGNIGNYVVDGGQLSYEEMTGKPYLEILSFSAFQANAFNGEFGGEIRLAKYFDGEKVSYFTGGSLSADIKVVQKDMYLSKEITQINNYKGPKVLMFKGDIAGA